MIACIIFVFGALGEYTVILLKLKLTKLYPKPRHPRRPKRNKNPLGPPPGKQKVFFLMFQMMSYGNSFPPMINLHFSELTTGSERLLSKSRCETTTTTDKGVFLVVYFSRVFRVFNTIVFIYFTTFVYFAISTLRQKL